MTLTKAASPLGSSRSTVQSRQRRQLVVSTTVNCLGNGAYLPMALLLLTTLTRLSLGCVGVVLTVAEFAALALMPVTGAVIDRVGAGRVQTACHLLRCVGFAAYPLTHSVWAFALAAAVVAAGERSSRVAGPALIAETLEGPDRDRYLVLDRALSNAGLGLGGIAAAALLMVGGSTAYVLVAAIVAVAFAVAAATTATMRCLTCDGRDAVPLAHGWRPVLADRPFRMLTLANTCAAFGYVALAMLVPLYAVRELHLPAALGGGLFTLNTIICAAASVPVSRRLQRLGLTGPRRAAVGLALMAAGFALMATAACVGHVAAAGVMVGAVLVYTVGEIIHSPAATTLALAASPDADRGHYLAIYQLSWALAAAAAPAVFSALVVTSPLLLLGFLVGLDVLAVALLRCATTPPPTSSRSVAMPSRAAGGSATTAIDVLSGLSSGRDATRRGVGATPVDLAGALLPGVPIGIRAVELRWARGCAGRGILSTWPVVLVDVSRWLRGARRADGRRDVGAVQGLTPRAQRARFTPHEEHTAFADAFAIARRAPTAPRSGHGHPSHSSLATGCRPEWPGRYPELDPLDGAERPVPTDVFSANAS